MDVFVCDYIKGRIRLNGPDDFRWIKLKQTKNYPFPKATLKVLPFLKKRDKTV
jgi:A/G-specific adenine glycosylase